MARAPRTPTLSASTLSLFFDCPRCFWRQVVQGIQRPRLPFPSITYGLDNVLKNACDDARGSLPPMLQGRVPGVLSRERFYELRHPLPNGFHLTGRLDDALVIDGRYAPLDHKTRNSPPPAEYSAQYYSTQMLVYTALLASNDFPVREEAYLVYYTPEDVRAPGDADEALLPIDFTITVQVLPTPLLDAWARIQQACLILSQPQPPLPGPTCPCCAYLEQVHGKGGA